MIFGGYDRRKWMNDMEKAVFGGDEASFYGGCFGLAGLVPFWVNI